MLCERHRIRAKYILLHGSKTAKSGRSRDRWNEILDKASFGLKMSTLYFTQPLTTRNCADSQTGENESIEAWATGGRIFVFWTEEKKRTIHDKHRTMFPTTSYIRRRKKHTL